MKRILSLALLLTTVVGASAADPAGTASVTVKVPVGATLTINGHPTHQMTAARLFVTPDLAPGKKYRYVFEATFTWNGEEMHKRKQLDLTVGTSYTVDMMGAETIKRAAPVEEPEPPPVVVPKKQEEKKPDPPKPAPPPQPPVRSEPSTMPKPSPPPPPAPKPEPRKSDPPKPSDVIPEPSRPVAPKPREAKPKA